jgi:hypothetical protein
VRDLRALAILVTWLKGPNVHLSRLCRLSNLFCSYPMLPACLLPSVKSKELLDRASFDRILTAKMMSSGHTFNRLYEQC